MCVGLSGIERQLARVDRLMQPETDYHNNVDPHARPNDGRIVGLTRRDDARTADGRIMGVDSRSAETRIMATYDNPEPSPALARPAVKDNRTLALLTGDDGSEDNRTLALLTGDDVRKDNKTLALLTGDDSNDPKTTEMTTGQHLKHLRMTSATRLDEMLDDDPNTNDPYFTFAPTLQLRQSVSTRWDNHVCSL